MARVINAGQPPDAGPRLYGMMQHLMDAYAHKQAPQKRDPRGIGEFQDALDAVIRRPEPSLPRRRPAPDHRASRGLPARTGQPYALPTLITALGDVIAMLTSAIRDAGPANNPADIIDRRKPRHSDSPPPRR